MKPTNPKDVLGIKKVSVSLFPATVMMEVSVALLEGALKYGRYNWRTAGVRESVYIDAAERHMAAYREGEDIDPDSGLSHITKAIASLTVLRDGMIRGNTTDDRPPKTPDGWLVKLNEVAGFLIERYTK